VLLTLESQLDGLDDQIAMLLGTVRNGLETLSGFQEPEPEESA
jgi:hypothetical protein